MQQAETLSETRKNEIRELVIKQYNDMVVKQRVLKSNRNILKLPVSTRKWQRRICEWHHFSGWLFACSEIGTRTESDFETAKMDFYQSYMIMEVITGMNFNFTNEIPQNNEGNWSITPAQETHYIAAFDPGIAGTAVAFLTKDIFPQKQPSIPGWPPAPMYSWTSRSMCSHRMRHLIIWSRWSSRGKPRRKFAIRLLAQHLMLNRHDSRYISLQSFLDLNDPLLRILINSL